MAILKFWYPFWILKNKTDGYHGYFDSRQFTSLSWTNTAIPLAYCKSGNIRNVLIFARRTSSRIRESRENYYYISATKEKWKLTNYKLREKSQNQKFAKI